MPQTVQIIRDVIQIDAGFPYTSGLQAGDTLRLIARQIILNSALDLQGKNLDLYATNFIAQNDAIILSEGTRGSQGTKGTDGVWGVYPDAINGSDGGAGQTGGNGTNGGAVKIMAEVIEDLQISVIGGEGGPGGNGGFGGKGATVKVNKASPQPIAIELANGGIGGTGGNGGNGGNGGTVALSSTKYVATRKHLSPLVYVSGGKHGLGGVGGGYYGPGDYEWLPVAHDLEEPLVEFYGGGEGGPGASGDDGADGLAGVEDTRTLEMVGFWASISSEPFAAEWAKYRHAVGEYFFRNYIPGAADRDGYIGRAVDEFQAALRLNSKQEESILRLEQIWNNMNPLGLPRNFDVIPNFKEYMANLTNLGNLVTTFSNIGSTLLLGSDDVGRFRAILDGENAQSVERFDQAGRDLNISRTNEEDIGEALQNVKVLMDNIAQRIEKAKEEMKKKPLTFAGVVGDLGQLAVAVTAVISAVPTGGASLVALAPGIMTLTKTIYDNAGEMVQAIMDDEETKLLEDVKKKADKVKKQGKAVGDASNKLIDLISMIGKIGKQKTPDNSKLIELVQQGAELAYEHLLKQQELERAQLQTKAMQEKQNAEAALQIFYSGAREQNSLSQEVIRQAGLKVIQAAQARVDDVLDFAFRAQRSIEIYLGIDQVQHVYFDVGRVHPDLEADYVRDPRYASTLTAAYDMSFTRLLEPTGMWKAYKEHFDRRPDTDIRRLSFTDSEDLGTFRETFALSFSLNAADLSEKRYDTKVQAIGIAFVGASGEGDIISCKIEHGGVYYERGRDGEIHSMVLTARHDIIIAATKPLTVDGFDDDWTPPVGEPQSSPLWGMSIGGIYTITVPENEFVEHHPTFEQLREIEVWIKYQFTE
ncbi:hypothetical protein HJFPF1_10150 [Paramyrothecium foliicola]|nr:hypothetical protein HJFPF1_10150 [Paramyrothecium foliicola]